MSQHKIRNTRFYKENLKTEATDEVLYISLSAFVVILLGFLNQRLLKTTTVTAQGTKVKRMDHKHQLSLNKGVFLFNLLVD